MVYIDILDMSLVFKIIANIPFSGVHGMFPRVCYLNHKIVKQFCLQPS